MSNQAIKTVIENCRHELINGKYIQKEAEMPDRVDFLKGPRKNKSSLGRK